MEYMGNKQYWDDKFENRDDKLLSPEKSVVDNIGYFKVGSVLDIACGDGRNTLFLSDKGFKVTGVDFSSKALERLKMFAERDNYLVNTEQIDLSIANSLKDIGIFDNILINHYRLNKDQLADIENHITDDGILFICGFGDKHNVDSIIKEEDLIQATDFENTNNSFKLIKYVKNQDDRGVFVTYIYCKSKI
jgi:tellurite methyltransferase